jgi:hypothetical protein
MPCADHNIARENEVPRYEFRIWDRSLSDLNERLEKLWGPQPAERTRETYIVSDTTDAANTKIRAGAIDIKVLLRIDQGLEQWQSYLKADFPIDSMLVAESIFPALRVDPPELGAQLFTAELFVETVVKPHPRLVAVELGKNRRRYVFGGYMAEFVEVEIGGRMLHSVAVESDSPRVALDGIAELAIGGRPNISYVRQIKSILDRWTSVH